MRSAAETVEKVDCGEYVRGEVYFNTTPDIRVPAFVLIPKNAPKPAPAIVALHDHGGFYLWGKEKIVDLENRSSRAGEIQRDVLQREEHRLGPGSPGLRGDRHRHVLLGRTPAAAG